MSIRSRARDIAAIVMVNSVGEENERERRRAMKIIRVINYWLIAADYGSQCYSNARLEYKSEKTNVVTPLQL